MRPTGVGAVVHLHKPSLRCRGMDGSTTRTPQSTRADIAAIVARIPLAEAGREMADEFRTRIAAFGRLSGTSANDILEGVERNLRRWSQSVSSGVPPADSDFDPLREWARARATEGVRLEDLLRAFGLGGQLGGQLIRRYAHPDETEALAE